MNQFENSTFYGQLILKKFQNIPQGRERSCALSILRLVLSVHEKESMLYKYEKCEFFT